MANSASHFFAVVNLFRKKVLHFEKVITLAWVMPGVLNQIILVGGRNESHEVVRLKANVLKLFDGWYACYMQRDQR